ncbi:MAG: hypothetical protein ACQSGP_02915 [Frankia sp.]
MTRWDMLRMLMRYWDGVEQLADQDGPWACSLTRVGLGQLGLRGSDRKAQIARRETP